MPSRSHVTPVTQSDLEAFKATLLAAVGEQTVSPKSFTALDARVQKLEKSALTTGSIDKPRAKRSVKITTEPFN